VSELLTPCPNEAANFYGIKVAETDGSPSLDGIVKLNFESGDFTVSLTAGETDEATIAFTGAAGGGGGFYGIIVKESDNSIALRDDTISFLTADFDVTEVSDKPQVAVSASIARLSDLPPAFYGITIAESDSFPTFRGINKVNFEPQWFYITQNSPNTDEVIVNFRGSTSGGGEANTASNLGAGEGIFAQKVGVDLQFKSLVAGTNISLASDANEITITGTASGSAVEGFYGINVGAPVEFPLYKNINTVKFDSTHFYVSLVPTNPDEVTVNLRRERTRYTIQGGVSGVGGNVTSGASYGNNVSVGDPTMAYSGKVVALSITLEAVRTNGTCTARIRKNNTIQVGAGQGVIIDGNNTLSNYAIITPPIEYVAGDRIGLVTQTVGFTPTGRDATIIAFLEESF